MNLSPVVDNAVYKPIPSPLWEELKGKLKTKVSPFNFNNWFRPVSHARVDGDQFIISVPNKFIADWITDYYIDLIEKEASLLASKLLKVRFEIVAESKEPLSTPHITVSGPFSTKTQVISHLNPKYNFESFVVGSGNQLAHAASKSSAELPGGHYNPLFLYGGVGLGKTHLLHAVGLAIYKKRPEMKILYLSSEKFMNEFINSLRHDRMGDFRKKYRETCDVLLIDDIQFLGGKESTQDEFFHTFNALYDSHRQIIVTSDKIPKEISGLEERLRSRFEWGLIADIQPPDLETRIAILRKKAEIDGVVLNNDVAMYLASQVKSNVRELEGVLIRLNALSSLTKSALTIDLAKEILKNVSSLKGALKGTVESIQQVVADYYQIQIADLKSQRRIRSFAYPRQVAMYLCRKHLRLSFPEIGHKFGGKDHTTVMHAYRKIETFLKEDAHLQNDVAILERTILH